MQSSTFNVYINRGVTVISTTSCCHLVGCVCCCCCYCWSIGCSWFVVYVWNVVGCYLKAPAIQCVQRSPIYLFAFELKFLRWNERNHEDDSVAVVYAICYVRCSRTHWASTAFWLQHFQSTRCWMSVPLLFFFFASLLRFSLFGEIVWYRFMRVSDRNTSSARTFRVYLCSFLQCLRLLDGVLFLLALLK